ncbi:MAG TPA: hypothetical protein PKH33_11555 [bacterium]|nr:hypothetical protein [bacterium]
MDIKNALEKNLDVRTEYGVGMSLLGGMLRKRDFKRKITKLGGDVVEDRIHEWMLKLGPVRIMRRSRNPELFDAGEALLSVSLFNLFAISNEKEMAVMLKTGPEIRAIRTLFAASLPLAMAAEIADIDLSARAGFRLNLSGLMRELNSRDEKQLSEEESEDNSYSEDLA